MPPRSLSLPVGAGVCVQMKRVKKCPRPGHRAQKKKTESTWCRLFVNDALCRSFKHLMPSCVSGSISVQLVASSSCVTKTSQTETLPMLSLTLSGQKQHVALLHWLNIYPWESARFLRFNLEVSTSSADSRDTSVPSPGPRKLQVFQLPRQKWIHGNSVFKPRRGSRCFHVQCSPFVGRVFFLSNV